MFSWWGSSNDGTKEDKTSSSKESRDGEVYNESTKTAENNSTSHKDATETAKDLAKNLGSFFYSVANVATQTAVKVKETVEGKSDILGDFNKEQEKFVTEKHSKCKETGVPPWVGYHEEETMKSQILALSSDERNFLRDPPAGVQFVYDYDSMFPVALVTLEEDPELKKMRFNLVPKKVKEINFWRNYFYRVSLIKQSSQLTSLASATGNVSGSSENQTKTNQLNTEISAGTSQTKGKPREILNKAVSENPNDDLGDMTLSSSPTQEFISDAYGGSQELSNEDLKQIGVERLTENTENDQPISKSAKEANPDTSKSNPVTSDQPTQSTEKSNLPDWERELQEELQEYDVVVNEEGDDDDGSWEKEIEDMLDAEES